MKLLPLIAFALCLVLSGCCTPYEFKESYDQITNPPMDWKQQAEFYKDSYPECSSNEKALMLASDMEDSNCKVSIVKKVYKVEVVYLYLDVQQIWPIKSYEDRKKTRLIPTGEDIFGNYNCSK